MKKKKEVDKMEMLFGMEINGLEDPLDRGEIPIELKDKLDGEGHPLSGEENVHGGGSIIEERDETEEEE